MRDFFQKPLTFTGFNSEAFPLKVGMRQGFLLLLLLFIMSLKILVKAVRKINEIGPGKAETLISLQCDYLHKTREATNSLIRI